MCEAVREVAYQRPPCCRGQRGRGDAAHQALWADQGCRPAGHPSAPSRARAAHRRADSPGACRAWAAARVGDRDPHRGGEGAPSGRRPTGICAGHAPSPEPGDVVAGGRGVCRRGEAARLGAGAARRPSHAAARVSTAAAASRAWALQCDGPGGCRQRGERVPERPAVCRLAGAGATPTCDGRARAPVGEKQPGRELSAHTPPPWSAGDAALGGTHNGPTEPMDAAGGRAPRHPPHGRSARAHACPYGRGAAHESPGL